MARILLGDTELEVVERLEDILSRISHAETNGPTVGGREVLPPGWMTARAAQFDDDVYIHTSTISYVRR
jgi:hypothetical protein